jgi:hypothetical protein
MYIILFFYKCIPNIPLSLILEITGRPHHAEKNSGREFVILYINILTHIWLPSFNLKSMCGCYFIWFVGSFHMLLFMWYYFLLQHRRCICFKIVAAGYWTLRWTVSIRWFICSLLLSFKKVNTYMWVFVIIFL